MANAGEVRPQQAAGVGEFAAAMRQLKERSGLTYRQLEERAAGQGEVLARSTLADVLGGKATPRPELVAAFVRACGDEQRVHEWLAARERAVSGGTGRNGGEDEGEAGDEPRTAGRRILRRLSRRRVPALLLGLTVLSCVAAAVWAVGPSGGDGAGGPGSSGTRTVLPHGPVEIRPVLADGLCLTDGHAEGYDSLVAVQRPCGDVAPQETELVPAGEDTIRVQWYHPDHGKGCLKAISVRTGAALLEPWDDCAKTSRFRVERSGSGGGAQYVLRVVGGGCVGISGSRNSAGAPAVTQPCDGSGSQTFSITPAH
ncbi:XRE family transcriptional regulator [Streptomyces actinomycinicus]|uniref:XRE family transcriptional regulator n=1 Tax=Streptomyces actinomycinicus TaxID=1695166 RepID=A0A937EHC8_9ACTN|nr:XRE family transcriptional regulator [Streptomyces actinomycinicus]MBL1082290.1 XRE family transcriptional regulator [Streptomyces actinomycinicus]